MALFGEDDQKKLGKKKKKTFGVDTRKDITSKKKKESDKAKFDKLGEKLTSYTENKDLEDF